MYIYYTYIAIGIKSSGYTTMKSTVKVQESLIMFI